MFAKIQSPQYIQYLNAKAAQQRIPLVGTFELTPQCNMHCKMCYVRMTPEQMQATGRQPLTVRQWIELAKQAKEAGMLFVLLTGGEPFLYSGFQELYLRLYKMGYLISINSNGTMIDEKLVAWLRNNPPLRINITIYGASNETYARLCGNPNGFTEVMRAIRLLREAGIQVKLNYSVTPDNVQDLKEILDFSDREKLVLQAAAYMFPPLRRDENAKGKNFRLSAEEAGELEAWIRHEQLGSEQFEAYCRTLPANPVPCSKDGNLPSQGDKISCGAAKNNIWITWDGRALPCGMLNEPWVDLNLVYPFSEAWKSLVSQMEENCLPASCSVCTHKAVCKACAAMCYTETGSFDKTPTYKCRMAENTVRALRAFRNTNDL